MRRIHIEEIGELEPETHLEEHQVQESTKSATQQATGLIQEVKEPNPAPAAAAAAVPAAAAATSKSVSEPPVPASAKPKADSSSDKETVDHKRSSGHAKPDKKVSELKPQSAPPSSAVSTTPIAQGSGSTNSDEV